MSLAPVLHELGASSIPFYNKLPIRYDWGAFNTCRICSNVYYARVVLPDGFLLRARTVQLESAGADCLLVPPAVVMHAYLFDGAGRRPLCTAVMSAFVVVDRAALCCIQHDFWRPVYTPVL